ncbi:hypothetical protein [Streptomyces sp. NPDC048057]|uniref:hypothetical protein n=1 Tax=Streptomyces sp. NPDC048057 TaxID=3155628 RepID=UPI003409ECBF
MAPTTNHRWFDVFQAAGTELWTWGIGEHEHYWGFSVRPFLANTTIAQIVQHSTGIDGNRVSTDYLNVEVSANSTFRFSTIWVSGA